MEFVPGGSISSLLEKFGSFPEPVSILTTLLCLSFHMGYEVVLNIYE